MKDRYNKILELLTKENKIEVNELSQILGVSNVTIRKDLDALEEKGIIKRGHGYAILANKDDINGRLAYHYEIKKRIATKAAELIHDGDTIMIERIVSKENDSLFILENKNSNLRLFGLKYNFKTN